VLNDAVVHDPLPVNGFPTPFLAPGAGGAFYGNNWWVLDASLAMPHCCGPTRRSVTT